MSASKNHPIAKPTGIAVMDRRLYYLDPKYEKVARVDAADGSGEEVLIDNEVKLRSLNIFRLIAAKVDQQGEGLDKLELGIVTLSHEHAWFCRPSCNLQHWEIEQLFFAVADTPHD